MGFMDFLVTSFKRIGFAIVGFFLMILSGSIVISATPVGQDPNIIVGLICVVIFLGIIMIAYAVKLTK